MVECFAGLSAIIKHQHTNHSIPKLPVKHRVSRGLDSLIFCYLRKSLFNTLKHWVDLQLEFKIKYINAKRIQFEKYFQKFKIPIARQSFMLVNKCKLLDLELYMYIMFQIKPKDGHLMLLVNSFHHYKPWVNNSQTWSLVFRLFTR